MVASSAALVAAHALALVLRSVASGQVVQGVRLDWNIGPCKLQVFEPCENAAIVMYLFTRDGRQVLNLTDPRPPLTFDPGSSTKLIVHGYTGHVDYNVTAAIRDAYLARGGVNVLVADWGRLSNSPCYATAVLHTWVAGRCVGHFLLALRRHEPRFRPADTHAVGFSLGAHVAAFASNVVRDALGVRFGRITGLDPALPFFATLKNTWKLDRSDADFVDIMHTNVGVFGKIEPTGHADFYMNGGSLQPACANNSNVPLCSHMHSPLYFAESVTSDVGFWGLPCPGYYQHAVGWCPDTEAVKHQRAIAGDPCDPRTRGIYFVKTNDQPPFALDW